MNREYDLIVIGLGPAGASLLYSAAEHDLNVIGIDKRREIGIPIQCGEFIPRYEEFNELLPETEEKYTRIFKNIPVSTILNKTDKVRLYTPSDKVYEVDFKGMIIDRERFDKWLVTRGIKAGGHVLINSRVYRVEPGGLVYINSRGEDIMIRGRVVAISAGASSNLLDMAGLYREKDEFNIGHVMQYVMAGVEGNDNVIEMFTGKRYSPGAYAWIIPRGDSIANVGVGLRYPYVDGDLNIRIYLNRFIKEHPIASEKLRNAYPISEIGGIVPVGPPAKKTVSDVFISLGDSANHVISSLGAGIVTSVIAGLIAGDAIAEYIAGKSPLTRYEELWRSNIGRVLEDGYKLRLAIDILTRRDELIDYGMRIIGDKYLKNLVYTKAPKGVSLVSILERIARTL